MKRGLASLNRTMLDTGEVAAREVTPIADIYSYVPSQGT